MNNNDNNQKPPHAEDVLQEQVEQILSSEVKQQLEACNQELSMWKDRCMRAAADFQNFQQRADKERALLIDIAQEKLLKDFLQVFDDVDRALSTPAPQHDSVQAWVTGFEMIRKGILKILEKYGVHEFSSYQEFDPEFHEGIMHVEDASKSSGTIVQVFQKGFMNKNKILRPAKVSVAK